MNSAHARQTIHRSGHLPVSAESDHQPWWPLATSMLTERSYQARIEGSLPDGLRGTLYRNGPGRFDRGGLRKNHLLDGDGMIQGFTIGDDGVRYQNRFVRTRKYLDESAANAFLYDTWSTLRPGAMAGEPPRIQNQAGVTVIQRHNTLYALDDGPGIYELDPASLTTLGPASLDLPPGFPNLITAHTQTDPVAETWTLVSGSGDHQHAITFDQKGKRIHQVDVPLPRSVWCHDFLMTQTHFVFVCHPLHLDLEAFYGGEASIWDSFLWQPHLGNLIVVARRDGCEPARIYEAPTAFMWHGLNAYDHGSTIVADIVGYTDPDHAFGEDPQLRAVMAGETGTADCPGTVRRLILEKNTTSAVEEILSETGHEFPYLDQNKRSLHHVYGYFATTRAGEAILPSGIARINTDDGDRESFEFDRGEYCTEPVFAADPNRRSDADQHTEAGWLMTVVNDGTLGLAHLAIFDAERVADGPTARVHLEHTTPLSFHGSWVQRG